MIEYRRDFEYEKGANLIADLIISILEKEDFKVFVEASFGFLRVMTEKSIYLSRWAILTYSLGAHTEEKDSVILWKGFNEFDVDSISIRDPEFKSKIITHIKSHELF